MALGFPDPDVMLSLMSARTYDAWQRYYLAEPWDVPRQFWPDMVHRPAPVAQRAYTPSEQPLADPEVRRLKAATLLAKFKSQVAPAWTATA